MFKYIIIDKRTKQRITPNLYDTPYEARAHAARDKNYVWTKIEVPEYWINITSDFKGYKSYREAIRHKTKNYQYSINIGTGEIRKPKQRR